MALHLNAKPVHLLSHQLPALAAARGQDRFKRRAPQKGVITYSGHEFGKVVFAIARRRLSHRFAPYIGNGAIRIIFSKIELNKGVQ